ncbi:MAG: LPS-assembly protein LptD [Flavobacteriaceae bacterium]|nr:LPS-assembly protein LptD [Flavobacteriaceae bacterium]MBL6684776.1 LPS-assembly protein LptD [Flavobacteriaceae bacterium]
MYIKINHRVFFFKTACLIILLLFPLFILSQEKEIDSIQHDTVNKKKFLLDKVDRKAKGFIKINNNKKTILLYDNAELRYMNIELKAGIIEFDWENNVVSAGRILDSVGKPTQTPIFRQGSDEVKPDSLRYNFDTKKALIWNSRSEQNDMNVFSKATKKENDSIYFIKDAKVTTSKNIDDPEYYIRVRTGKFIPKNKIIAGPSNLYIYDVPTPIFLPFAYFPLSEDRNSGFLFPTIGQNNNRGYFLQNGGYYFAPSDYFDLTLLGDYYTNGSYGMRIESNYRKRYAYSGKLSFRFENLIDGERGLPGYSKSDIYNVRWSHSQDSKANPNNRFSASVNLGSSNYFRESLNQINTPNFLNNTLNSSISFSKTFRGYPSVNMSLTASHSQNTRSKSVNLILPTFQGNMERIYPFVKKNTQKKGIFENINFQYTVRGENRINTTDSLFLKKGMFDDAKYGMKHTIPISTNFKMFKHFSVSLNGNFEEVWTGSSILKNDFDVINNTQGEIITIKGFNRYNQYDFGLSIGTTIYGLFNFKKGKKIESIRHVIRPSISYNTRPSFEKYYDTYIIDADGNTADYTRFEDSFFGRPSKVYSSNIGLNVSNNIEAKIRERDSTVIEPKKVKILNNLNFSTSYNIAADSLRLNPIRMNAGTTILNNKLNLNIGATFDPYIINANGTRINKLNITNGGGLVRMTSANINLSYAIDSKSFDSDSSKDNSENLSGGGRNDDLFGQSQDLTKSTFDDNEGDEDTSKNNLIEYINKIGWDFRLAHSLTYLNNRRQRDIGNNSLMFSGNIMLSKKWKVGGSSGFDFKNKGFTYTQLRFERDLDSWKMNFSWVPFSVRESWYFFIGIKSGFLSDLKYDKRKEPDKRL